MEDFRAPAAKRRNIFRSCRAGSRDGRGLWFVLNMDDVPREFSLRFDGAEKMRPLGVSAGDETAEFRDGAFNFKLGEWGWAVLAAANGK